MLGLFSGELIFGGGIIGRNFAFQNGLDLTVKTACTNGPWAYICSKGCFTGLMFGGAYFGGAYYWKEFCVSKWVGLGNKKA